MRKVVIALATALLGTAACKAKDKDQHKESAYRKPAERDFAQERTEYSARMRERLERVDLKLRELAGRTEEGAQRAAAELHVRRDQLARQLDTIGSHSKEGWEKFEADLTRSFDDLERDINNAMR